MGKGGGWEVSLDLETHERFFNSSILVDIKDRQRHRGRGGGGGGGKGR